MSQTPGKPIKKLHTAFPYWFESRVQAVCGIPKARFHKVRGDRWESICQRITDTFADKTRSWKNGLHWAGVNGYSPKAMKHLTDCFQADYQRWFLTLPELVDDDMVHFLIDYCGTKFLLYESGVAELVQALTLLNQTGFLGLGFHEYYLVSKKFQWIIGFNHHDVVSVVRL